MTENTEAESIPLDELYQTPVLGFRIYGDNIEECIKFGEMLIRVGTVLGLQLVRVLNELSAPVYILRAGEEVQGFEDKLFVLHVCGRYGEWDPERRPFVGHEDSDVILTFVGGNGEAGDPILSVEFNDAIPAGNNAWQRFPRVAQAAEASVPCIYSIPVCDAEVYKGELRSLRHPNTVFSAAQLVLMARYKVPSLTIYAESPWYLDAVEAGVARKGISGVDYESQVGRFALLEMFAVAAKSLGVSQAVRKHIADKKREVFTDALAELLLLLSYFVSTDISLIEGQPILEEKEQEKVIEAWWEAVTDGKEIPERFQFYDWTPSSLKNRGTRFVKATSTASRFKDYLNPGLRVLRSARKADVLAFASMWDVSLPDGITKAQALKLIDEGPESWKTPLSYKPPANEIAFIFNVKTFAHLLADAYPKLDPHIIDICRQAEPPILFLPIAGYVEDSGGVIAFSRPDKGLVGLMRCLFADSAAFRQRLVLMYHQEIPVTWEAELRRAIAENRGHEIARDPNNLWRETALFASAVIIDHLQEGAEL